MLTSVIFVTFNAAFITLFGWLIDTRNVEKMLGSLLHKYWNFTDNDALICEAAILLTLLNAYLAGMTVAARNKYGVKPPITHPEAKDFKNAADRKPFLQAVRAHENFLENITMFCMALIVNWFVLGNKALVSVCTIVFVIGRILYGHGYTTAPSLRGPGFMVSSLATWAINGPLMWKCVKAYL